MPVQFVKNSFFKIIQGSLAFSPNAEEIYSVIFEDKKLVRGTQVSKEEFVASGLQFSQFVADPLIVLEVAQGGDQPLITFRFLGREGSTEVEVAHDGESFLDYAVGNGRWIPLSIGGLEEAIVFLNENGLGNSRNVTLSQYMKCLHWSPKGLIIEDRTEKALWASAVAPTLQGDPPKTFIGSLYPYQLDGFRWLVFMIRGGLGCIIADEMGLGKTVQVICLLLEVVEQRRVPNLVIATATLLENWRRELSRFAPKLRVLVHSGSRRTGFPSSLQNNDVVITSFETAVADITLLRNVEWNVVVVDEAQGIKNPDSKRTIQLKTLPRTCAVAVTGTPVENHLRDLWSIADFVLPSLLGSLSEFELKHPDSLVGAAILEPKVSPLILRRTVNEVARDLPERIDIPQPLELDETSAQTYEAVRNEAAASGDTGLAVLTKLRMFCAHPWLTGHFLNMADPVNCSTKLRRLFEILEEMVNCDGKAIIFTSYQKSIDILISEIGIRFGIPVDFIDGRVAVQLRQQKIDALTATKSPAVLVLNPKAAGTGLNITAANHVIHFNLEWNPAVEDQASARAYRRGQLRSVTVHRFFYVNTIEEVINDRMQRKRELATVAVVGTEGQGQEMNDILRALRISPVKH